MSSLRFQGGDGGVTPQTVERSRFNIPIETDVTQIETDIGDANVGAAETQPQPQAVVVIPPQPSPAPTLRQAIEEIGKKFDAPLARLKRMLGLVKAQPASTFVETKPTRTKRLRIMQISTGSESANRAFIQRRIKRYRFIPKVQKIMLQKGFRIRAKKSRDYYVVVTPRDLGFTEPPAPLDLLDEKFLAQWSGENFEEGYVIEKCHYDVALFLIGQYKKQPKREVLWIAMEPFTVKFALEPDISAQFTIDHEKYGQEVSLGEVMTLGPRGHIPLDRKYLYRLRKVRKNSERLKQPQSKPVH